MLGSELDAEELLLDRKEGQLYTAARNNGVDSRGLTLMVGLAVDCTDSIQSPCRLLPRRQYFLHQQDVLCVTEPDCL